jgi:hypothetical protein
MLKEPVMSSGWMDWGKPQSNSVRIAGLWDKTWYAGTILSDNNVKLFKCMNCVAVWHLMCNFNFQCLFATYIKAVSLHSSWGLNARLQQHVHYCNYWAGYYLQNWTVSQVQHYFVPNQLSGVIMLTRVLDDPHTVEMSKQGFQCLFHTPFNITEGCAITEAAHHRLPSTAAWIWSQVRPFGICVARRRNGVGFL